jgi:hypothetical protein
MLSTLSAYAGGLAGQQTNEETEGNESKFAAIECKERRYKKKEDSGQQLEDMKEEEPTPAAREVSPRRKAAGQCSSSCAI